MCLLLSCRLYLILCVGVKLGIEEHIRTHVPDTWRRVKNWMWTSDKVWIGLVKHMKFSPFCDVTQHRLVVIEVSGQPIGSIFKGEAVQEHTLEVSWRTWREETAWVVLVAGSNIKMEGTELRCDSLEGIDVAQDRGRWQTVVDAIWNIQVLQKWNFLASRAVASSSRRTVPLN